MFDGWGHEKYLHSVFTDLDIKTGQEHIGYLNLILNNKKLSHNFLYKNKLPKTYMGYKVVDGDNHDLRFLDKKNIIVGLKIKGKKSLEAQNFFVDIK